MIISVFLLILELNQKDLGSTCDEFRVKFSELSKEDPHTMYLFINKPKKHKRSIESTVEPNYLNITSTEETRTTEKPVYGREKVFVDPDEPVLYDSQGKAMLYSTRALILQVQNEPDLLLGASTWVATDDRDTYTRLIATIPIDEGKITLRFK